MYHTTLYILASSMYAFIDLYVRTKQVIKVMRANDKGDKKNRFKISVSIG